MLLAFLLACAKGALPQSVDRPLLFWEVRKGDKVSHLLGTCHVGVALDDALPPPHDEVFATSRVLVVEAELDFGNPTAMFRVIRSGGAPMSTRLATADWLALSRAMREGVPAPMLDRMPPWLAASMLPMMPAITAVAQGKGTMPMDLIATERAKAAGIPVHTLETLEQQAAILGEFDQLFLDQLHVTAPGANPGTDEALAAFCREGDLSRAAQLFAAEDPTTAALLDRRNLAWAPTVLAELEQGGALVAVGAGHMVGPTGLIAQAENAGFTVRQQRSNQSAPTETFTSMNAGLPAAIPIDSSFGETRAKLASGMSAQLCAEGQIVRTCFIADEASCLSTVAADTALCADQWADQLAAPDPATFEALVMKVGGCAISGALIDTLAAGNLGNAPMCEAITQAMSKVGK